MSFGENITINSRAPESFVSITPAFILHTYTTKDTKKLHKRRTYSGLRPPHAGAVGCFDLQGTYFVTFKGQTAPPVG